MQMFRVKAISEMVDAVVDEFIVRIDEILQGTVEPGFELMKASRCAQLCSAAKDFDYRYGFQHRDVLRLELQGNNYIKSMMTMLWSAIQCDGNSKRPFERFIFGEISENYRRVYENTDKKTYAQCQLLCDAISGMTESYLIKKHNEFRSLEHASS